MRGPVDREKITLTGAPETMLATLYCRALDSEDPRSVLHDREAARAVARIDYDFERTRVPGQDVDRDQLPQHPAERLLVGADRRCQLGQAGVAGGDLVGHSELGDDRDGTSPAERHQLVDQ